MIKVGIWAETLCGPSNGTRTLICNLVIQLAATGLHQVTLICPYGAKIEQLRIEFASPRIHIVVSERGRWRSRFAWLLGLGSLSRIAGRQDVWLSGWHWPLGRMDAPFVAIVHDVRLLEPGALNHLSFFKRWFWYTVTWISLAKGLNLAERVICVSEFSQRRLVNRFPRARVKCEVIYNGVDWERWAKVPTEVCIEIARQQIGLPTTSRYIFALGAHSEQKNFAALVGAFAQLVLIANETDVSALHLVIGGREGPATHSIRHAIEAAGVSDRVILATVLSDADVHALMHDAEVFAFPSLYEGFGIPVLEAFAAGTPVVASDIGALKEITGDAAVLTSPTNINALSSALLKLLSNLDLREVLSARGRKRAREFDWSRSTQKYLTALDLVASAESSRQAQGRMSQRSKR